MGDGRYGKYEVYLSTVTLEELKGCSEPKQSQLFDYLGLIDYTLFQAIRTADFPVDPEIGAARNRD